jgi:hypothetical protein
MVRRPRTTIYICRWLTKSLCSRRKYAIDSWTKQLILWLLLSISHWIGSDEVGNAHPFNLQLNYSLTPSANTSSPPSAMQSTHPSSRHTLTPRPFHPPEFFPPPTTQVNEPTASPTWDQLTTARHFLRSSPSTLLPWPTPLWGCDSSSTRERESYCVDFVQCRHPASGFGGTQERERRIQFRWWMSTQRFVCVISRS